MSNTNSYFETQIYLAAKDRLIRHFSIEQSKVLAALMVAQSKFESANYTSPVFLKTNNAFGYKYYSGSIWQVKNAPVVGSPEGNNYAVFASVGDSARETADWIGRRQSDFINVTTPEAFGIAMHNNGWDGLTTGSQYGAGVAHYFKLITTSGLSLITIGIALLFFFSLNPENNHDYYSSSLWVGTINRLTGQQY